MSTNSRINEATTDVVCAVSGSTHPQTHTHTHTNTQTHTHAQTHTHTYLRAQVFLANPFVESLDVGRCQQALLKPTERTKYSTAQRELKTREEQTAQPTARLARLHEANQPTNQPAANTHEKGNSKPTNQPASHGWMDGRTHGRHAVISCPALPCVRNC